jgi:hypothetical protein
MKWISVVSAFAVLTWSTALALSMAVSGPQVAFPAGVRQEQREQVLDFLNTNADFKSGKFINEHTWCSYAASAEVITELIGILASEGQLAVTVRFARMKDMDIAFRTYQTANEDISLTVNIDYRSLEPDTPTTAGESFLRSALLSAGNEAEEKDTRSHP